MRTIVNGHSEDKTFLSDTIVSLLEWCLNYKKTVYFGIADARNIYNVKIEYDKYCSEGRYNEGHYECYLMVTFSNINNEQLYYDTLFVNSDDPPLSDVVESFEINYLSNDFLERRLRNSKICGLKKNINSAASTYISNLVYDRSLVGMEIPEGIRYFIREAFIAGANYVIDNTKKERDVKSSVG